jgi:hypothetical protein
MTNEAWVYISCHVNTQNIQIWSDKNYFQQTVNLDHEQYINTSSTNRQLTKDYMGISSKIMNATPHKPMATIHEEYEKRIIINGKSV